MLNQRCTSGAWAETAKNKGPIDAPSSHGTQTASDTPAGPAPSASPIGSHAPATSSTPRCTAACAIGRMRPSAWA